ncbi:uncharacterized protein LOC125038010 [Penaeus chinensis]|uniref:uncharacterized protein LOC125038010 n=1 Tax=Penaeus chinensis TaxID=139456 RepID=UPI001FB755EB|nr:uncharacterized protein LOC125038010 [Penaeus chinensis]
MEAIQILLVTLTTAAFAAPQGYAVGAPSGAGLSSGPGPESSGGVSSHEDESSHEDDSSREDGATAACKEGEVLHVDGTCVVPDITRKVYLFEVPEQEQPVGPPPSLPPPAVEHNILFVRLPEGGPAPEPIVLPPPRQNNIVYVLNKQDQQVQRVIEVPAYPQVDPEIYFVNYQEGENPTLPFGVNLETVLSTAAAAGGQVLGGVGDVDGAATGQGGSGAELGSVSAAGIGLQVNGGAGVDPSGLYATP